MSFLRSQRLVAITATALFLATAMGPVSVLASTPSTYAVASGDPPVADPGAEVGFTGWIANTGTSNISQLYLSAVASDPSALTDLAGCLGSGTSADPIYCELGQLNAGQTSTVTFLAKPAVTVAVMTVEFTWTFTGRTSSDTGGTSHGDSVVRTATVTFRADGNSSGRFLKADATSTTVQNDQNVDFVKNPQALKVTAPGTGMSAYVRDGLDNTNDGDNACTLATCPSLFGEWMSVGVRNGYRFLTPFEITITYDGKALPKGVTTKTIMIYHNWWSDLHRTFNEEIISNSCTFAGGSTIPSNAPCLTAKKGANLVITLWTYHNGGFRGAG